jgi:glyoxylase-like metal-dependent hydrolase (beta-lactamase superfamily II)
MAPGTTGVTFRGARNGMREPGDLLETLIVESVSLGHPRDWRIATPDASFFSLKAQPDPFGRPHSEAGVSMSSIPEAALYTAEELARLLEAGAPIQIMDVRAPHRLEQGRIDLVPPHRFHNVRGSELINRTSIESTGLDPELPVAVVCGAGKDSAVLAFHLSRLGLDARSLDGGLAAWYRVTLPRELDAPESLDRLVQFDRIGKGCLGYLLVSDGEAVAVDPPLDHGAFTTAIEAARARLVAVVDTHAHADYVSGGVPMARGGGAPYYLHPADGIYPYDGTPGRIEFQPLSDGQVIPFGRSSLRIVHTPGHTEGSVSLLVEDRVAFTGDFLFVESIGRPDLGGQEEVWAHSLWESVERARNGWHESTAVYPGHYAGEGERRMGQAIGISLGTLLEENPVLQIKTREEFVQFILDNKASFPEGYRKIKALNLGLLPIDLLEVEELEVGRNECALGGVG